MIHSSELTAPCCTYTARLKELAQHSAISRMEENLSNSTNTTECEIYDSDRYTTIAIIAASVGTFSFLASISVISVIVIFKKYNVFIQRLILYLCITAAINSASITLRFYRIGHTLDSSQPALGTLCVITAFVDQTSLWSFTIAFGCLTFNMLIAVLSNKSSKNLEMGYIVFIFLLPLMFNWIPFVNSSYGEAGAWCWIKSHDYINKTSCPSDEFGKILQFALWYVPHYLLVCVMLVAYIVIIANLIRMSYHWRGLYHTEAVNSHREKMKELVLPLIFYPLGFFILNLMPLINRVYNTGHTTPNYILWVLHATFSPLQGGYIALVYVLDKDTMRRLNFRELRAYLFHRQTPVEDYPATKALTDSYNGEYDGLRKNPTHEGSENSKYGSFEDSRFSSVKSEKV